MYLASNADGYNLVLSPVAVRQAIGMARSTYHDQFHKLVDKGYLVPSTGNTFEFYETDDAKKTKEARLLRSKAIKYLELSLEDDVENKDNDIIVKLIIIVKEIAFPA